MKDSLYIHTLYYTFPLLSSYQGGTGYAITNDNLQAKEKRPMLQV